MGARESEEYAARPHEDEQGEVSAPSPRERDAALAAEVDDLLDEIDDVLEENAEEFVRGFVQKGGQ